MVYYVLIQHVCMYMCMYMSPCFTCDGVLWVNPTCMYVHVYVHVTIFYMWWCIINPIYLKLCVIALVYLVPMWNITFVIVVHHLCGTSPMCTMWYIYFVSMHLYIYLRVYIYLHVNALVYIFTYVCISTYMSMHLYIYLPMCVYLSSCQYTCISTYVSIHLYIYL